jgi:dTDP-4-amino-4,6-dideoxygalactose transaminase
VPAHCEHNGHLYYLLLPGRGSRDALIGALRAEGVDAPFHYIPLHSSDAGRRFGRSAGSLAVTDDLSDRLIRLPIWSGMAGDQDRVIACVRELVSRTAQSRGPKA